MLETEGAEEIPDEGEGGAGAAKGGRPGLQPGGPRSVPSTPAAGQGPLAWGPLEGKLTLKKSHLLAPPVIPVGPFPLECWPFTLVGDEQVSF